MLATSDEARTDFEMKYSGQSSLISAKTHDGKIALITTASALGRSSLYNRLRFADKPLFHHIGYTSGSGDFHFMNGLYSQFAEITRAHSAPTAKNEKWGNGFRNRREIIRKCLKILGLPHDLQYHGVRRELFAAPLADNAKEYLCGIDSDLKPRSAPASLLTEYFLDRWLLPRLAQRAEYVNYQQESYRILG